MLPLVDDCLLVECPKCFLDSLELEGSGSDMPDPNQLNLFYADDEFECPECDFTCTAEEIANGDYRNLGKEYQL